MTDKAIEEQPGGDNRQYKLWQSRIEREKKAHKEYRKQAEVAEKAARDDGAKPHEFNIWWGSCKVTRSAIYGARPKPDVRRRFQKPDPEEKELARLVERALEYQLDTGYFSCASQDVVKDYVESGLGVPKIYMDVQTQPLIGAEGPILDEEGEPAEEIVSQSVGVEHIPYKHFHWEPGKSWESCNWVAFESYHPKKELEAEYGVKIAAGKDDDAAKRSAEDYADETQVYEIWHKPSRTVIVYSPAHPTVLEERQDKLNLQGFFPCPRPLFANLKSDELIPKPDYQFIESQIVELNRTTARIKKLIGQVRANGFTDASIAKEISRLVDEPDGTIKPIVGLLERLQSVGGKDLVHYLPMLEIINAVRQLQEQRDQIKAQIYEVTGISDIVRGATQASETATAQQLKGQWANVRLSEKTQEVARIWRDVFRQMAEIICEHFDPMVLQLQTGIQITPRMHQMMRSDVGRSFAIDVETDSTLAKDDYEERQQVMELIDTILARLEQVVPAVMQGALPVEFVQEALLMIVSRHKHGKQLEDAIMGLGEHWTGFQQFQQQLQQMQQQMAQQDQMLQQAGQQVQGLQGELSKVNERDEMRKDAELRVKLKRESVEAQAQEIENRIVASDHGIDYEQKEADVLKTYTEIDRMRQPQVVPFNG